MENLCSDLDFYISEHSSVKITGRLGTYVGDMNWVGSSKFLEFTQQTHTKTEMSAKELSRSSTGVQIVSESGESLFLPQHENLSGLDLLPEDASYNNFTSMKMSLA